MNHNVYRGRELEGTGRRRCLGGKMRALVRGGWGFVNFNEPSQLRKRGLAANRVNSLPSINRF